MGSELHLPESENMAARLWELDTLEKAQACLENSRQKYPITLCNYVSNVFDTSPTETGAWVDSFDPKTGKLLAYIPNTQPEDVDTAIKSAADAFPGWSRTPRAVQSKYLRRIADLIQENRELFAVWESIDQGKTLARARVEIDRAVANFSYGLYILRLFLDKC